MTDNEPELDPINVVLCDEVRREETKKEILIGVYSGDILIPSLPAIISLTLWVHCKTHGRGRTKREVRIISSDGEVLSSGTYSTNIEGADEGYMSAVLGKISFQIQKTGTIKFQWRKHQQRWRTLLSKNILESGIKKL